MRPILPKGLPQFKKRRSHEQHDGPTLSSGEVSPKCPIIIWSFHPFADFPKAGSAYRSRGRQGSRTTSAPNKLRSVHCMTPPSRQISENDLSEDRALSVYIQTAGHSIRTGDRLVITSPTNCSRGS